MSLIKVSGLTFGYEGSPDNVFEQVSFQIDTAWHLGFIGRNGRGKTTFLNLLQGNYQYTGTLSSNVPFEYFPAPVADPSLDTLSVVESLDPQLELWRLERELSLLEVDMGVLYRPFSTLSGGEQTKVLLAALFLRPDAFLLIDEPTNHLDLEGRQVVSAYLKKKPGFLLVSHDRAFLDGCIDHVLSINKLDIEVQQGNFSSWQQNKERRDQSERAENEKLKRDIVRLDEAARRTADWSDQLEATKWATRTSGLRPDRGYIGHKAAKLMKRSKQVDARRQNAVDEKSNLLKNIELVEELKLHPLRHPKQRLLEFRDLSIDYGDGPVCAPVSFSVERDERVALAGRNGTGKSSLLKLALGESLPYSGLFSTASGLIVSYVPQDPSFLQGDLTRFAEENQVELSLFKTILRKLDFSRAQFEKDMFHYSAGQKKKVLLARSLCQQAHLYLWDEPLNYIDLFSRMQLETLLQTYQPTLLLVEHDQDFLNAVATRVVFL